MTVNNVEEAWDVLVENSLVSNQTLEVITSINGYNLETMEDVLYATTGYRNFAQYLDEEEEND